MSNAINAYISSLGLSAADEANCRQWIALCEKLMCTQLEAVFINACPTYAKPQECKLSVIAISTHLIAYLTEYIRTDCNLHPLRGIRVVEWSILPKPAGPANVTAPGHLRLACSYSGKNPVVFEAATDQRKALLLSIYEKYILPYLVK